MNLVMRIIFFFFHCLTSIAIVYHPKSDVDINQLFLIISRCDCESAKWRVFYYSSLPVDSHGVILSKVPQKERSELFNFVAGFTNLFSTTEGWNFS